MQNEAARPERFAISGETWHSYRPMFSPASSPVRAFLLLATLVFGAVSAHAQLAVELQIKRRIFMVHEPILATVVVHNNAGRDVVLADTEEGGPWFSFHITAEDGRMVPPHDSHYEVEPLQIKAGETVKRTVNLNTLFPLGDFGSYRIKAAVYYPPMGKYFASKFDHFGVIEGKLIWRQTVGVPEGVEGAGEMRKIALLTMEMDKGRSLYVRVEGDTDGIVYGCYNLGPLIEGREPSAMFDAGNNLAVLQLIGPKTYLLSRIGVNGNFIDQGTYVTPKIQPFLRKTPEGALQIVGAIRQQDQVAKAEAPVIVPKVSDRPAGF